jgi:FkbM family methyltransferase
MPFSHELPYYRKRFPLYARNIVDVAGAVSAKDEGATCIDIGANIGDTAIMIQEPRQIPTLCVEGDRRYLEYLRANTGAIPGIEVAPVFVAEPGATGLVLARDGTARLSITSSGMSLPTATLTELVESHPRFRAARLVKIDTDGMDIPIMRQMLAGSLLSSPSSSSSTTPTLVSPQRVLPVTGGSLATLAIVMRCSTRTQASSLAS